jgi:hypothetical protein
MINYYNDDPPLDGVPCPACGKKSWDVFTCSKCGAVFCRYCNSENVIIVDDIIQVTCKCGSTCLFA